MKNVILIFVVLLLASCNDNPTEPIPPNGNISEILESKKQQAELPSIIGGFINIQKSEYYSSGLRKLGTTEKVTDNDYYHIGSNTKAMTATMIAILVEENKLKWDSKIKDVFPEFSGRIPIEFEEVTLTNLLVHRAGLFPFTEYEDLSQIPEFAGEIINQRKEFSLWLLAQSDIKEIGITKYSNAGYVIASSMAEKVTGKSWENLMAEKLFSPLQMSVYFEWPAQNKRSQPWGHIFESNTYLPFDPDGDVQFPEIFNPSGNISIKIIDYLKFLKLHIDGYNNDTQLLKKSSIQKIHTAVNGYSMGWLEIIREEDNNKIAFHEGSDDTFNSFMMINYTKNNATVINTNAYSSHGSLTIIEAAVEISDSH